MNKTNYCWVLVTFIHYLKYSECLVIENNLNNNRFIISKHNKEQTNSHSDLLLAAGEWVF